MKICGIDIEKMKGTLNAIKVRTQLNNAFGLCGDADYAKTKCETIDFCIALLNKITAEEGNKTLSEIIYDIIKEKNKSKYAINDACWITVPQDYSFKCSHCGKHSGSETDFCPHCGSRMVTTW